jgi:type IV secretion system protein VirB8
MSGSQNLDAYWREAAAWDFDRIEELRRSERNAWRVAVLGGSCALLCAAALALLVPLKRLVPFVIRVDNTTGIVDVVPTTLKPLDPGQAVTRYLLTHYVTVCQRFNFATAPSDYRECGAFHSAQRNEEWYALWNPVNPQSPLNLYKDGTTVRTRVVAVSFLRRTSAVSGLAQVRYVKERRPAGGAKVDVTHWIATIEYAYAKPSADIRTRSLNPLGFKVLKFIAEPEVISDPAPPPDRASSRRRGESGGGVSP